MNIFDLYKNRSSLIHRIFRNKMNETKITRDAIWQDNCFPCPNCILVPLPLPELHHVAQGQIVSFCCLNEIAQCSSKLLKTAATFFSALKTMLWHKNVSLSLGHIVVTQKWMSFSAISGIVP